MHSVRVLMIAGLCAVTPFSALIVGAQQAATRAQAERDPILKAMLVELDRNQKGLELKDSAKPYFMEFRIDDVSAFSATASNGAITGERESHSRVAHVRVRVGDYKFDNSHGKAENDYASMMQRYGMGGDGMISIEVVDDDPIALRFNLWNATDTAYKLALDDLARKQAELKAVQAPPQADSFTKEKPVIYLEPAERLALDRESWKRGIEQGSGLIYSDPPAKAFASELEDSAGEINGRVRTEYLVNSEGTIVRKSFSEYQAEASFSAQAADGMRLERSARVSAPTAEGLGSVGDFHASALKALTGLDELVKAPIVADEYHGPVLLSGNATTHSFETLFANAIEARTPAMDSTARTLGAYESSYKTRVLPDFLSVVDDPTLMALDGKELLGAYKIDDEGVPGQKVAVVQDGKLLNYLLAREPIRDFPQSNGHGRADTGQAPAAKIGVLKIEAAGAVSEDELTKKLIAMGKDQGLIFVYQVATLGGNSPRTLYRIKVEDGTRELVRGAELGDFNLHEFRSGIVAAGDKPVIYNIFGDIPATVIAPPLLFDDLTVKRAPEKDAKLPYYPPPSE